MIKVIIILAAKEKGYKGIVSIENAEEASMVEGINVLGVKSLLSLKRTARGGFAFALVLFLRSVARMLNRSVPRDPEQFV